LFGDPLFGDPFGDEPFSDEPFSDDDPFSVSPFSVAATGASIIQLAQSVELLSKRERPEKWRAGVQVTCSGGRVSERRIVARCHQSISTTGPTPQRRRRAATSSGTQNTGS
jgi:hypothetical protein